MNFSNDLFYCACTKGQVARWLALAPFGLMVCDSNPGYGTSCDLKALLSVTQIVT